MKSGLFRSAAMSPIWPVAGNPGAVCSTVEGEAALGIVRSGQASWPAAPCMGNAYVRMCLGSPGTWRHSVLSIGGTLGYRVALHRAKAQPGYASATLIAAAKDSAV